MSDDKWFTEDPLFAWGINYTQLSMYRRSPPHAGYEVLLKWAKTLGKPYFVSWSVPSTRCFADEVFFPFHMPQGSATCALVCSP